MLNHGGPAFPRAIAANDGGVHQGWDGMSLWDHYAGLALQGFCASNVAGRMYGEYARMAGDLADAMIAERERRMGGYSDPESPEFPAYVDAQGNEHAEF